MNSGLRLLHSLILVIFISGTALSQDSDLRQKPIPTKSSERSESDDPKWNRWTSESFVVHALTNDRGKYLRDNLEGIKKWILERWGLHQIEFGKEPIQTGEGIKEYSHVKLWCIDDPKLFKDRYSISESKVEISRKSDGSIKNVEVFLLLDESPAADIPVPLTEALLVEFEDFHKVKFGWWAHRGMSLLNGTVSQIKSNLVDLNKKIGGGNQKIYLSKSLLTMTKENWEDQTEVDKLLFDEESAALCLLLRKEGGQLRFLNFLKESEANPEKALRKIYSYNQSSLYGYCYFKDWDQFNASFHGYMKRLSQDVVNGKTPNDYLNIKRVVK